nr:uncharacterized protein LOC129386122 [Dermacentor andersoni]
MFQKPQGKNYNQRGNGEVASTLTYCLLLLQIGFIDVFVSRCTLASAYVGGEARLQVNCHGLPFTRLWDQQTGPAHAESCFFKLHKWQLCILENAGGIFQLQKPRSGTTTTGHGTGNMASTLTYCLLLSQALAVFLQVRPPLGCTEGQLISTVAYHPEIKSSARADFYLLIEIAEPFLAASCPPSALATASVTSHHVVIPAAIRRGP